MISWQEKETEGMKIRTKAFFNHKNGLAQWESLHLTAWILKTHFESTLMTEI